MSEIQRYREELFGADGTTYGARLTADDGGVAVLYADHLAAVKQALIEEMEAAKIILAKLSRPEDPATVGLLYKAFCQIDERIAAIEKEGVTG